jgi:hypothetical protein
MGCPMVISGLNMSARNWAAEAALSWGRNGDWNHLADHVEQGGVITADIRKFLAAVLRREIAAPNNRAPTARIHRQSKARAELFLSAMANGKSREKAKDHAANEAGVDRRTIDRDLKRHEANLRQFLEYEKYIIAYQQTFKSQQSLAELRREYIAACQGDEPVHWKLILRYWVSPTALSQHFMS